MLTQQRLKSLLTYNQETGLFFWQVNKPRARIGQITGQSLDRWGYKIVSIDRKNYKAHRLAWLYTYGNFPVADIDHINRIKTDNRIINLREVTSSQNARNRGLSTRNKSGYVGVSWKKSHQKWCARATENGKVKYLGLFDDLKEAVKARQSFVQCHY